MITLGVGLGSATFAAAGARCLLYIGGERRIIGGGSVFVVTAEHEGRWRRPAERKEA